MLEENPKRLDGWSESPFEYFWEKVELEAVERSYFRRHLISTLNTDSIKISPNAGGAENYVM